MAMIYVVVVLGGPYAEGYWSPTITNKHRDVFSGNRRIVEASPMLRDSAKITANKVEFLSTGATITAIASDYAGAAGSNPTITVFDELWGVTSERGYRLYGMRLCRYPPARLAHAYLDLCRVTKASRSYSRDSIKPACKAKRSCRLYIVNPVADAGRTNPLRHGSSQRVASQMRAQLRPNAYLRQIENRWVTSEQAS